MTALKAMTIWSAWQHFEEDTKGSIEVGKLADFVILDKDPTTVDPEMLDQIKVAETIKEGVTVFSLTETKKAGAHLRPGERSELAFTRAMFLIADNTGHHNHDYVHRDRCLCGAISKIAAAIGGGEGS
jgi:adenine deaminase